MTEDIISRPRKSLGQNFLIDKNITRKIVNILNAGEDDTILEIGPGRGALTEQLYASKARIIALEKDLSLALQIRKKYPEIMVIAIDALKYLWEKPLRTGGPWKAAGNLPYNVASPIIWDFVSRASGYEIAVFMVQKEVAQRIVAGEGTPEYGALSVWIQSFAAPGIEFVVGPNVFRPRPRVESAVVSFKPLPGWGLGIDRRKFAYFLKFCFQSRRKQLYGVFKRFWNDGMDSFLARNGLGGRVRAEELSPGLLRELSGLPENEFYSSFF